MTKLGYPSFEHYAWASPSRLGADLWTTQVAMLLGNVMCLAAVRDRGIVPDLVLGHSDGEFSALLAAGAWDLPTAIRMTRARCEAVEMCAKNDTGLLATGASEEVVRGLSANLEGAIHIASYNAPNQIVVGGLRRDLEKLAQAITAQYRHARMLPVPAAFHTPWMGGSNRIFERAVRSAKLTTPRVPVYSAMTNRPVTDADAICRVLTDQLTGSMRYAQLIGRLGAERRTVFVEIGPQQTLTRLNRRILDSSALVIACDNAKRPGLEPLLGVQALLECLGVSGPGETPPSRDSFAPDDSKRVRVLRRPGPDRDSHPNDSGKSTAKPAPRVPAGGVGADSKSRPVITLEADEFVSPRLGILARRDALAAKPRETVVEPWIEIAMPEPAPSPASRDPEPTTVTVRAGMRVDLRIANAPATPITAPFVGSIPLISRLRRHEGGAVTEMLLDPRVEPFLTQHRYRGKPVLPAVIALEALAQSAALATGKKVTAFQQVDMTSGLTFHVPQPLAARLPSEGGGIG